MNHEDNEIAEKRIHAAVMLSESGEYADALILLLEAVKTKMNDIYLAASLREGFEAETFTDYKQFFAGNNFFRKDFAAVFDRIAASIVRSSSAQHRVLRKEFLETLDDIKLFFQDADRYTAGREALRRKNSEHKSGTGVIVELLKLSDKKLDSAALLFDAKKYDECLIILCEAFKIKLKSLLLSSLGELPDGDVFALFAEHFFPAHDDFFESNFNPLVSQMESLCAAPSVQRTIDRTTCQRLLEDTGLFFRGANRAVKKKFSPNMCKASKARFLRAAPWLAGIVVMVVAGLLVTGFFQRSDGGLTGTYYTGIDLSQDNVVLQRKDRTIDFNWAGNPPDSRMPTSLYSVRWTGKFFAETDRDYSFYTISDDGVRLWVNSTLIIDNWQVHGQSESRGGIFLKEGWHDIRLDYFQEHGDATIRLLWDGSFLVHRIIPPKYLKP